MHYINLSISIYTYLSLMSSSYSLSYGMLPPISLTSPSISPYAYLSSLNQALESSESSSRTLKILSSPKIHLNLLSYLCQASEQRNMPIILRILDFLYPKLIPSTNNILHL